MKTHAVHAGGDVERHRRFLAQLCDLGGTVQFSYVRLDPQACRPARHPRLNEFLDSLLPDTQLILDAQDGDGYTILVDGARFIATPAIRWRCEYRVPWSVDIERSIDRLYTQCYAP